MRLRQLATTQSIEFLAPPEVHQSILDSRNKSELDKIDSHDVICWLLEQTCNGIEQQQPLHYSQGMSYCYRTQTALENPEFLDRENQRRKLLEVLREEEHQTLPQLYGSKTSIKARTHQTTFSPAVQTYVNDLAERRAGFLDNGIAVHASAVHEVEQEREVAYEVEAIREVQKPNHFHPLGFPGLHSDILDFATTGKLSTKATAYENAFKAMGSTSLGQKFGIHRQDHRSKLFMSREFMRSVKMPALTPADVTFIVRLEYDG